MATPVVGLTTYRETAAWGVWHEQADVLPASYARSVEDVGGIPVLLPANAQPGAAATVVARLDALVVTGGADVDPAAYGASPHPAAQGWRPERDAWELALLDAAEAVGVPVLGVCRGMQLMAVHAGGRLEQHVPDVVGHDAHSPGGATFGDVEVDVVPGTRLASMVAPRLSVSCHHHQSVRTHPGFEISARATDGVVEAIERPDDRFWLAVQWHPETAADVGVLAGLVRAAVTR